VDAGGEDKDAGSEKEGAGIENTVTSGEAAVTDVEDEEADSKRLSYLLRLRLTLK